VRERGEFFSRCLIVNVLGVTWLGAKVKQSEINQQNKVALVIIGLGQLILGRKMNKNYIKIFIRIVIKFF